MRRTPLRDVMLQAALAGLILLPLVLGFTGAGSFEEVYATTDPGAPTSRRALLFEALARSSWIGIGACAVALGIGIPVAWLLSRRKRSLMFLALCALPLALAPSVAVSGWLQWWAQWKEWTGVDRPEIASAFRQMPAGGMTGMGPLFSIPAVAIILGLGLWPIVAYELWPAFVRARGEAYEAALLAGSPLRAFFRVALPMSRGELAAGALLVFLLAASDFTVSSLLLIRSLPIEVHDYLAQGKTACAAWAALPLVALTAFAAVVLARVHANKTEYISEHTGGLRAAHVAARGRWSGAVLVLGLVLGFAVPLAGCFAGTLTGAGPWLRAFRTGVEPLTVSVRLAVAAAVVAVLLGALRIAVWPGMRTRPINGAALLLLVVPGSFLASGLLAFQLQSAETADAMGGAGQWLNQALPVGMLMACGYVLRFLYLPLRLADEGLRTLDPAMLEAAELAGQSRFAQGLGVALPQLWGHLLAAGALVFVLALGELPVSDKLAPPGAVPVSVWLFDEQHRGYTDAVFALSLLVGLAAAVGLLGAGCAGSALRKFGARRWEVLTGGKP
ncbi:MAG: iron ABC transporter permease [Planctomycetes bacterium]|nr:iron ABC transporter permease [Planctomycetota bacterium]